MREDDWGDLDFLVGAKAMNNQIPRVTSETTA